MPGGGAAVTLAKAKTSLSFETAFVLLGMFDRSSHHVVGRGRYEGIVRTMRLWTLTVNLHSTNNYKHRINIVFTVDVAPPNKRLRNSPWRPPFEAQEETGRRTPWRTPPATPRRGLLCNWLVCMAVYLASMAKDATGKAVAIWLPISAFVTLGALADIDVSIDVQCARKNHCDV